MLKKNLCLIFYVILVHSNLFAYIVVDSGGTEGLVKPKHMSNTRQDTLNYKLPFLTIHLGGSIGASKGSTLVNGENTSGSRLNFQNDLGFPSSTFFPRLNIILAATKRAQFIFDINNIKIKKNANTPKDFMFGDVFVPANSSLKSEFNMFFTNLAYRNSFTRRKHFDFGGLIGLDLHDYSLKLRNNETSVVSKKSFAVWTPFIGLDIYGFLHKDFFFRGTLNVAAFPFHNYDLTQISFKSYLEYYIMKNVGLGVSYNSFYSDIREFSKLNGSLKYQIHSVSLFASFRFN